MRKYLFFFLLISAWFFHSCSNDFDLIVPGKNIPVVYGLLNLQDQAHYLRVEKAFVDPNTSALEIAQNPDSLFYQNVTVQLKRLSDDALFNLTRIDGNTEGLPKEDGIFATAPNYLYKIDSATIKLKAGEKIGLIINRGDELPVVTAETTIVPNMEARKPKAGQNIGFTNGSSERIFWTAPAEARIFDVQFLIKYDEFPANDPNQLESKTLTWLLAKGLRNEGLDRVTLEIQDGLEFYSFLSKNIPVNTNLKRIFRGMEFIVTAGGTEIEQFINIGQANTGITGSQEIPTFTNLSEGRGIFSSRNILREKGVQITSMTRDSLRNGFLTKDLNFL